MLTAHSLGVVRLLPVGGAKMGNIERLRQYIVSARIAESLRIASSRRFAKGGRVTWKGRIEGEKTMATDTSGVLFGSQRPTY